MQLGPVEIVVIAFPENRFSGLIVPEVRKLVDAGTVTIIDGVFAMKDADGSIALGEFGQLGGSEDASALGSVMDRVEGIISDEDVEAFTSGLEPNSSAAILAFEHTWMTPLRDAIVASGGVLLDSVRIPGAVVEEILATVPDED